MTDQAAARAGTPDPRFEKFGVPAALFIGKEAGQWVITAFTDETRAAEWMKTNSGRRQMFQVTLSDITELELVAPKPFLRARLDAPDPPWSTP